MNIGGQSWNRSLNHKSGMQTRFKCSVCGRDYKQDWTRNRHQKLCKEREKSAEKKSIEKENSIEN